ncbi:MAG: cyclic nucleotide-binding domain-containing protein, partial [Gammaproteobacteria bacterium]|nr:cyclic nucleotide-binding domain-containing protein [Gammaproteobacteria bacterium]
TGPESDTTEQPLSTTADETGSREFQLPSVFSFLLPEEQEEFVSKARSTTIESGTPIISEGETGDSMYIIKNGVARVVT